MGERLPRNRGAVTFGETMDPNTKSISDNGRLVGILVSQGDDFFVEWHTKNGQAVRTPMDVLEAVVGERDRIVKEQETEK